MPKPKPFRYKRIKKYEYIGTPKIAPENVIMQEYSGEIDGMKAAKGEENLFNAAYKTGAVINHQFRMAIGAPRNMPGYKELDFLFVTSAGEYVAIQVRDYDFVHKGISAESQDESDDAFMLNELNKLGVTVRGNKIYSVSDNDLETPEDAKEVVESILL